MIEFDGENYEAISNWLHSHGVRSITVHSTGTYGHAHNTTWSGILSFDYEDFFVSLNPGDSLIFTETGIQVICK